MSKLVLQPKVFADMSFGYDPGVAPVWTTLGDLIPRELSCKRGRNLELNKIEAGSGKAILDDQTRALDPNNAASPYYPNVIPEVRMRLRVVAPGPGTTLTPLGGEITDAIRAANVQGDGRAAPDSSTGIWEGTTNLVTNGGIETNTTGWAPDGNSAIARVTTPAEVKFGGAALQLSLVTVISPFFMRAFFSPIINGVIGTTYTASVWIKAASAQTVGKTFYLRPWDGVSGGFFSTIVLTGAYQRITCTFTAVNTNAISLYVGLEGSAAAGDQISIDGVQFEQKPYATPYVHTDGATATRLGAGYQALATYLDTTQGVFAARVRMGLPSSAWATAGTPRVFLWRDAANIENLSLHYQAGNWVMRRRSASVNVDATIAGAFAAGDIITVVGRWGGGTIGISVNGSPFTNVAATSPAIPGGAYLGIGCDAVPPGGQQLDGDILWSGFFTGTFTSNDLSRLDNYLRQGIDPITLAFEEANAVTMTWDGVTIATKVPTSYNLSVTGIEDWAPLTEGMSQWDLAAQPSGVDAMAALSAGTITGTRSAELSSVRLGWVLDQIGFSATDRNISTGDSVVQGFTFDNYGAKQHSDDIAETENGLIFVDGSGRLTFHDRQKRLRSPYLTPIAVFGDGGGAELPYLKIEKEYSSRLVYNDIHGKRANDSAATEYVVTDSVSKGHYRQRSMTWTPWLTTDAEVQDGINYRLSFYKDPVFRFTKITLEPQMDDRLWEAVFAREISDRITVIWRPKALAAITQDCHIESIEHKYVRGRWTTIWELSPASIFFYWLLGTPGYSEMGQTTRVGY